jgi:hypothetical protein
MPGLRSSIALMLALFGLLSLSACSSDAERVIKAWEQLATLLGEEHTDCAEFAAELDAFREAHADIFDPKMRPVYEQIQADLELRVRFERSLAQLDTQPFACRDDAAVQAATSRLFEGLLSHP